jgi:hypothetical protein
MIRGAVREQATARRDVPCERDVDPVGACVA